MEKFRVRVFWGHRVLLFPDVSFKSQGEEAAVEEEEEEEEVPIEAEVGIIGAVSTFMGKYRHSYNPTPHILNPKADILSTRLYMLNLKSDALTPCQVVAV